MSSVEEERRILTAIFHATSGSGWANTTGVTVENGYLVTLDLKYNGLRGSIELTGLIPPELGSLEKLKRLSLSHNRLTGSIPTDLGSLEKLDHLDLSFNELTGSIPEGLTSLEKLEHLGLSDNKLTGPIPAALIGRLGIKITHYAFRGNNLSLPKDVNTQTHLTKLDLSHQDLVGRIPQELRSLENLEVLSLSYNRLTESIPSELGNLSNLRELGLNFNNLKGHIPKELGSLKNLTVLNLWENQLSGSIPKELGDLKKLERLLLSRNKLTGKIPSELGSLHQLTRLDLASNDFSGPIPPALIRRLGINIPDYSFSGNNLSLPGDIDTQTHLTKLDLSNQGLVGSIPVKLGQLSNLRELRLNGNNLEESIPPELGGLQNLEILLLNNNKLTGSIPRELGDLKKLERLLLRSNKLTGKIPSELGDLHQLTRLDLASNDFCGPIPPALMMRLGINITNYSFSGNTLSLPEDIDTQTHLPKLDLSNQGLEGRIPPPLIGRLGIHIKIFAFGGNSLRLPKDIHNQSHLTKLELADQGLEGKIPKELGELRSLTVLDLSDNKLRGAIPAALIGRLGVQITSYKFKGKNNSLRLPKGIGTQSHLTELDMSDQGLEGSIPSGLKDLQNLKILNLNMNRLKGEIPKLDGLTNLTTLHLAANNLSGSIPAWNFGPGGLHGLTTLSLSSNELTELDLETAQSLLEHTPAALISGNAFANIPNGVCRNGLASVVRFLEDLAQRAVACWDLKVVLLGSEGAGKTSLVRSIVERGAAQTEGASPSTVLVDTHVWQPRWDDKTLNVHFWDIGGQHCSSAILPLFLTEGALYVLAVDLHRYATTPSSARCDVTHWLEVVQEHCPGSVLVVVGTHTDEFRTRQGIDEALARLNREVLDHRESMSIGAQSSSKIEVKEVFALGVDSPKSVQAVMDHIQSLALGQGQGQDQGQGQGDAQQAQQGQQGQQGQGLGVSPACKPFPDIGKQIPKSWRDVYNALDNLRKKGRVFASFSDVVEEVGRGGESTTREALRLHQNAGFVLWGGHADDVIYLDPAWLMALLRPLADHKLSERRENSTWEKGEDQLFAQGESHAHLVGGQVVYRDLRVEGDTFCHTGHLNRAYLSLLWKLWHQCPLEGEVIQGCSDARRLAPSRVLEDAPLFKTTLNTLVRKGILIPVKEGAETSKYVVPARLASMSERGPLRAFRRWGTGGRVWEKRVTAARGMPFPMSTLALFLASVGSARQVDIKACSSRSACILIKGVATFVAVRDFDCSVYVCGDGVSAQAALNTCHSWLWSTLDNENNKLSGLGCRNVTDPPPTHTVFSSLKWKGAVPDAGKYDVFLSHSGEEKRGIGLTLHTILELRGIPTFLDEPSLHGGDRAEDKMLKVARTAPIGVIVLSPSFVCREWPLQEMQIFMERAEKAKRGEEKFKLVPLFFGLTAEECGEMELLQGNHPSVKDTWDEWKGLKWGWQKETENRASDLAKRLLTSVGAHTGVRNDQREGLLALAERVANVVEKNVTEFEHEKRAAPNTSGRDKEVVEPTSSSAN